MKENMFNGIMDGFVRLFVVAVVIAAIIGGGGTLLILWACGAF